MLWKLLLGTLWDPPKYSNKCSDVLPGTLSSMLRADWLLRVRGWRHLGAGVHAEAFRSWLVAANCWGFQDRRQLNWLRATAALVAQRGRHHKLTRVDAGRVPSSTGVPAPADDGDDDVSERGVTEEVSALDQVAAPCPLSSHEEVEAEAAK
jgi:hypothetical protein